MIGFFLMVFGTIVIGLALGTMFTAQIGWITIGTGAILIGLMYTLIEYKEDSRGAG